MSEDGAKKIFNKKVNELNDASSERSLFLDNERYEKILREVKEAQLLKKNSQPLTSKHYRRLKRYDIMKIGDTDKLIETGASANDYSHIRYYCKTEELFDVLERAHVNTGHKRTRVMETELKKKYCNVTRQVIDLFLTLCEPCQLKKIKSKRELVIRPILSDYMNSRSQVDFVDMQSDPDGEYRFIMNYQDHLTKFTILRPLKHKTAEEVAHQLLDIFSMFGAPFILHSDGGREYANEILQNLAKMWPGMKLVHAKQRQISNERSNQDVRDKLAAWMSDNKTKTWSKGLQLIQSRKNRTIHSEIKTSPHEAMFGTMQRIGLADSFFTENMYSSIKTEEELEQLFNAKMMNDRDEEDKGDDIYIKNEYVNEINTEVTIKEEDFKNEYGMIYEKVRSGSPVCDDQFNHGICEGYSEDTKRHIQDLHNVNKNQTKIEQESIKNQVQNKVSLSHPIPPMVSIGTNVVVALSDVDQGRLSSKNVLAVVVDVSSSGLYRLGNKKGLLERLYADNEFTIIADNFMDVHDVPSNSISMIAPKSNHEIISCSCKRYCINSKCKCRSKEVKCNSKCHSSSSCKNK